MDVKTMDNSKGPLDAAAYKGSSAAEPVSYESLSQEQITHCVERCAEMTQDYIAHMFGAFWKDWVASISKREENARSNKEQLALSETLKLLQQAASQAQQKYLAQLADGFQQFAAQQLHTPSGQECFSHSERLSLVDNAELEETIAITSICHRADSQQAAMLWPLHQRLALLNDGKKVDERSNPASPIQFCEALRRILIDLKLDVRTKVMGYKHFEAAVIKPLAGLYQELNNFLLSEGVLPNLRQQAVRGERETAEDDGGNGAQAEVQSADTDSPTPQRRVSDRAEPSVPRRRASDQLERAGDAASPEGYQQGLVSAIRLLQTHIGQSAGAVSAAPAGVNSPAASAVAGAGTFVAAEQLLGAVQQVQQTTAAATRALENVEAANIRPLPVAELSAQLMQQLHEQGEENIRSDDMHTIELVGLLFEYILSDDQLPDSVKALLSYLHTPVLKLAFIDKDFFDNVDHPARMLLNQMAQAGSCWVSNDGTSQYNIYPKIKTTVFFVLENFGNEVKVFAEALMEFSTYTRNVSRRQELMEKRALEKARGEEKLREAKIQVNREISARIDGKDLPSPVLLLLLLPWSDYLSFLILRYGAESDSCACALAVVDDILWSVEPKILESDKVRQLDRQKALMASLREGFETIGYEQNKARKLLDAVTSLQTLALKSHRAEPAPAPMRNKLETMAAEKAGNTEKDNSTITDKEAQIIEKLKLIEFGTWFESDTGKRLKVAWYNHKTMHYMLVDQQGRKMSMSSALQLARQMIAGELRVVAGSAKPFFERALENIYHSLNARASGELLDND